MVRKDVYFMSDVLEKCKSAVNEIPWRAQAFNRLRRLIEPHETTVDTSDLQYIYCATRLRFPDSDELLLNAYLGWLHISGRMLYLDHLIKEAAKAKTEDFLNRTGHFSRSKSGHLPNARPRGKKKKKK